MLAPDDDVIVLGTTGENDLSANHDFAVNQLMGLGFDVVRVRIMSIFGSLHVNWFDDAWSEDNTWNGHLCEPR